MVLLACIEKMNCDQQIKIGSKKGHSYFYIGTAGDFLCRYPEYSDKIKQNLMAQTVVHKKRITQLLNNPPEIGSWARREIQKPNMELTYKEFMEYTNFWLRQLEIKTRLLGEAEAQYATFKSLWGREVIECRDSCLEPDVKILIIEGTEQGSFWDGSECKAPAFGLRAPEGE